MVGRFIFVNNVRLTITIAVLLMWMAVLSSSSSTCSSCSGGGGGWKIVSLNDCVSSRIPWRGRSGTGGGSAIVGFVVIPLLSMSHGEECGHHLATATVAHFFRFFSFFP